MISRRSAEIGLAVLTGAAGVAAMVGATEYGIGWSSSGPQPGAFPFYMGLLIAAASAGNIVLAAVGGKSRATAHAPFLTREQASRVVHFALPIVGFVAVSLVLGLYVGTALYMFGTLALQNGYSWTRAAAIAIGLPIFFYVLIERTFQVGMLKGPLEAALGL